MPNFQRCRVPGGSYFFTVNLLERRGNTLLVARIDLLRDAVRRVRLTRPFAIDAWVVLPDHIHAIWTLPPDDDDFSTRWRLIKTFYARGLPRTERLSRVRSAEGERGIWQRRFWEHTIRDDEDYAAHMDYVHFIPVKHSLVASPADWPYSSCVSRGLYPPDWNGVRRRSSRPANPAAEGMRPEYAKRLFRPTELDAPRRRLQSGLGGRPPLFRVIGCLAYTDGGDGRAAGVR